MQKQIFKVQKVKGAQKSRCKRSKVNRKNTDFNGSKVKEGIMAMFLGSKVKLVIVKGQLKHCKLEFKL